MPTPSTVWTTSPRRTFRCRDLEDVGTELRSVERVTARLTRRRMLAAGALSGFWIGQFVGLAFSVFADRNQLGFPLTTPLLGAVFGAVWSQLGYRTLIRRGGRYVVSVNQIVATKYEVLVEHPLLAHAHDLVGAMQRRASS